MQLVGGTQTLNICMFNPVLKARDSRIVDSLSTGDVIVEGEDGPRRVRNWRGIN